MSGGLPAWDDDEGLIAWVEANKDRLTSRKLQEHEAAMWRVIEEANRADVESAAFPEFLPSLRLRPKEKAALKTALVGAGQERLTPLASILRDGRASSGMQWVLSEMIAKGGLHAAGAAKREEIDDPALLPSTLDLKTEVYEFRAALSELFPDKPIGKRTERAYALMTRKYGCGKAAIKNRVRWGNSYGNSELADLHEQVCRASSAE